MPWYRAIRVQISRSRTHGPRPAAAEKNRAQARASALAPVVPSKEQADAAFLGKGRATNLESYGDYANVCLASSYVRHGAFIDLQNQGGKSPRWSGTIDLPGRRAITILPRHRGISWRPKSRAHRFTGYPAPRNLAPGAVLVSSNNNARRAACFPRRSKSPWMFVPRLGRHVQTRGRHALQARVRLTKSRALLFELRVRPHRARRQCGRSCPRGSRAQRRARSGRRCWPRRPLGRCSGSELYSPVTPQASPAGGKAEGSTGQSANSSTTR